MSSKKTLVNTIIIASLSVMITYLINFYLTTFITDALGTEAYGFVTLAKTAVSYATILTVAFTTFMVRFITLEYHKGDFEKSRIYYSSAVAAASIMALVIMGLLGLMLLYLPSLINIPSELIGGVKVLFVLVFLDFSIVTLTIPFTSVYYIKDKLTVYNSLKTISYVTEAIFLLTIFSICKTEIWYVGTGLIVASLIFMVGSVRFSKKITPELYFSRKQVSISKIFNLATNGIWQSINSLGTVLNSGLDLWISNIMLSPFKMGQLSITKTIGTMFIVLYSMVAQAFQPRMLQIYASGDTKKFLKELKFAMKVCGSFSACAFAGFFSLGKLYYRLWLPNQDYNLLYWLTVVTVLSCLTDGIIYPAYFVNTLTMKKKIPCFITVVTGIANVIGMLILLKYTNLGIFSIVWTTTVLMLLTNGIINPIYCAVTLKLPWYTLLPLMIRHLISSVVMLVVFVMLTALLKPSTWLGLILVAMLLTITGLGLYAILLTDKEERSRINAILSKEYQKKYQKERGNL